MSLDHTWFSEVYAKENSAFSLKITEKLYEEQSPFQRIEVYETLSFGRLLVIDGVIMLTDRDNFLYHEMMAHPALFTHPNPKRVLIIGGGDCGTLREVLKHPELEEVVQVDIDEAVTRAAVRYFPKLTESNHDPRAKLYFEDGLKWVREAPDGYYDLIIVDSTDPVGPAVGLFNGAFVRDCFRALSDDGLLVQQSESPLYNLQDILLPMYRNMYDAGFKDVHSVQFPQCVYQSGWWTATLARKNGQVRDFRVQAAAAKSFPTEYYNLGIHQGALGVPEFMQRAVDELRAELGV